MVADMMPKARQVPKEAGPAPEAGDVRISGAGRLRRRLELWKCTLHEVEGQFRVVATGDIAPGEVAFSSRAYETLLLPRNEATHCAQCLAKFGDEKKPKRCGGCKAARYCGLDCQRAAWRGPHRVECKCFGKLRRLLDAPDRDVEGEFLDCALAARTMRKILDDERRGDARGTEVVGKYTPVAPSVVDVMNACRVCDDGAADADRAKDAARCAAAAARAGAAKEDGRLATLLRSSAATHFMVTDPTTSGIAVGCFALGAAVRHSCLPSCAVAYDFVETGVGAAASLEQRFVAMVPLKAGDELTRAWVDPMSPTWLRHHRLKAVYGGVLKPTTARPRDRPCDCARCAAAWADRDALIEGDAAMREKITETDEGKAALETIATFQREASAATTIEDAYASLTKAMDVLSARVAPCHPAVLSIVEMLMANALARGENAEAIGHARTLAERRARLYAPLPHPRVVLDHFMLAELILQDARGDPAKGLVARPALERARDLARLVHGAKRSKLAARATSQIDLIDGDIRAVNAPKRGNPMGKGGVIHPPMPEPEGGYPRSYAATRAAEKPKRSPDLLSNAPAARSTEKYYVPEPPLPGVLHIEECDLDSASDYSIDD